MLFTEKDYYIQQKAMGGALSLITGLTQNALPNSEFEIHAHYNDFEIYQFLEGNLFFAFEGKRFAVSSGTVVIIANGTLHRPIIKKPCRYFRKHILFSKEIFTKFSAADLTLYNRLRQQQILVLSPDVAKSTGVDKMFLDAEEHIKGGTPYDDFCAIVSIFSLLIAAEKNSTQYEGIDFRPPSEKATDIINYIDSHLKEDLCYKTISEFFYISEKSLYKFFKKETGFTLSSFIKERRIVKAQSILNAGGSAYEAADEAGFRDYSVFYRNFKREVGMTPQEYSKIAKK